jgi:hypothetical protein
MGSATSATAIMPLVFFHARDHDLMLYRGSAAKHRATADE